MATSDPAGIADDSGDGDGDLLGRFATARDQTAFAALVDRHAGLVLGVCRRVLGAGADAEDAAQATFIVLARRATGLRRERTLGPWLHGVAWRCARRIATVRTRQRRREIAMDHVPEPGAREAADTAEALRLLDEELARMPAAQRGPLVLCYLQGRTHLDAARMLGVPAGSLSRRVGQGLERLRQALAGRGVVLSAAALGAISAQAQGAAPAGFAVTTAGNVMSSVGTLPPVVAGTAKGVLLGMAMTKAAVAAALSAALLIVMTGIGVALRSGGIPPRVGDPPAAPAVEADPLPPPLPTAPGSASERRVADVLRYAVTAPVPSSTAASPAALPVVTVGRSLLSIEQPARATAGTPSTGIPGTAQHTLFVPASPLLTALTESRHPIAAPSADQATLLVLVGEISVVSGWQPARLSRTADGFRLDIDHWDREGMARAASPTPTRTCHVLDLGRLATGDHALELAIHRWRWIDDGGSDPIHGLYRPLGDERILLPFRVAPQALDPIVPAPRAFAADAVQDHAVDTHGHGSLRDVPRQRPVAIAPHPIPSAEGVHDVDMPAGLAGIVTGRKHLPDNALPALARTAKRNTGFDLTSCSDRAPVAVVISPKLNTGEAIELRRIEWLSDKAVRLTVALWRDHRPRRRNILQRWALTVSLAIPTAAPGPITIDLVWEPWLDTDFDGWYERDPQGFPIEPGARIALEVEIPAR